MYPFAQLLLKAKPSVSICRVIRMCLGAHCGTEELWSVLYSDCNIFLPSTHHGF